MVLIVVGIAMVAAGVGGYFLAMHTKKDVHAMIAAETLTVAELSVYHDTSTELGAQGSFRRVCEVVGTAQPGPHGVLAAELSKTPCVWHRHEVHRRYRHESRDSEGRRRVSERTEKVADLTTDPPFAVQDQTGQVLVHPNGAKPDGAEKVLSRFEPHVRQDSGPSIFGIQLGGWNRDDTIGYEYSEWVLRPGIRLYVHGEASDQSGQLAFVKPAQGPFIISTRTEEELRSSKNLHQKLFAFGGAGVFVLGIVLTVIGIIR